MIESDEILVEKFIETHEYSHFTKIYKRYRNKVYAKCLSILTHETDSHDATQDIFIKVLMNLQKFNRDSKFSTWLYSISNNHCIDIIRKRSKGLLVYNRIPIGLDVEDEVWDHHSFETRLSLMKSTMNKLKWSDQKLLRNKYQEGLTIKDICEITGKSESAIKMQIVRAKERFRRQFRLISSDVA